MRKLHDFEHHAELVLEHAMRDVKRIAKAIIGASEEHVQVFIPSRDFEELPLSALDSKYLLPTAERLRELVVCNHDGEFYRRVCHIAPYVSGLSLTYIASRNYVWIESEQTPRDLHMEYDMSRGGTAVYKVTPRDSHNVHRERLYFFRDGVVEGHPEHKALFDVLVARAVRKEEVIHGHHGTFGSATYLLHDNDEVRGMLDNLAKDPNGKHLQIGTARD